MKIWEVEKVLCNKITLYYITWLLGWSQVAYFKLNPYAQQVGIIYFKKQLRKFVIRYCFNKKIDIKYGLWWNFKIFLFIPCERDQKKIKNHEGLAMSVMKKRTCQHNNQCWEVFTCWNLESTCKGRVGYVYMYIPLNDNFKIKELL